MRDQSNRIARLHRHARTALALLAFALLCWLPGLASAANFSFDGTTKYNSSGCSLSGSTYTCSASPLGSADTMSIATGVTVNFNSNTTFAWANGVTMSGTARLNVTGNLDMGGINPSLLKISGGTLNPSGSFAIGANTVSLTANVIAASATLGGGAVTLNGTINTTGALSVAYQSRITGAVTVGSLTTSANVTITGNIVSSGVVNLGSYTVINGSTKGTDIITYSSANGGTDVDFNGDVTASGDFALANGSTVTGNVSAKTMTMYPSHASVTGSVTASTSLTMGDTATISGDVTVPSLTMQAANGLISGNATVGSAYLDWGARVAKTIYCTGGTTAGDCDCVSNYSGYPTDPAGQSDGPTCASKTTAAANTLHHLQITHDGAGAACSTETVTVAACSNATCTSYYTGGVTATLAPGGTSFTIGSGGTGQGNVKYSNTGTVALSVSSSTPSAPNALVCVNSAANSSSCNMSFNGSVGLSLSMADQQADAVTTGTLTAAVLDPNSNTCVAAFPNVAKTVTLGCSYANPTSGTLPVSANFDGLSTYYAASANAKCDGTTRSFANVLFNLSGVANVYMRYPDVGSVTLTAATTNNNATISSSKTFVVAPAAFQFSKTEPPPSVVAGVQFNASATAMTANGAVAPNFGKETVAETVTFGVALPSGCAATQGILLSNGSYAVSPGVGQKLVYTEAGAFNLTVQQTSANYLSGAVARPAVVTASPTNSVANSCGAIASTPAYFQVMPGRVTPLYYYSGQPLDFTVTAMNGLGAKTQNYDTTLGYSKNVTLSVVDAAGAAIANNGALSSTALASTTFAKGVSTVTTASAAYNYKFNSVTTAPTTINLRAADTGGVSSANASSYGKTGESGTVIRSGRIRIGNAFGTKAGDLKLPVSFEYYTGTSWLRNVSETGTTIPSTAIGIKAASTSTGLTAPTNVTGNIVFASGAATLTLRPQGGTGSANVVFNLGATGSAIVSCLSTANQPVTSTGASLSYLRAPNGLCPTSSTGTQIPGDPVARATFGVFTPENKRIIHAREVFN